MIKFNSLLGTADIRVHVVHTSSPYKPRKLNLHIGIIIFTHIDNTQYTGPGPCSNIQFKTSYHKILLCFEAARFVFRIGRSLRNLTGTSAVLLPVCLSNFIDMIIQTANLAAPRLHETSVSALRNTVFSDLHWFFTFNRAQDVVRKPLVYSAHCGACWSQGSHSNSAREISRALFARGGVGRHVVLGVCYTKLS